MALIKFVNGIQGFCRRQACKLLGGLTHCKSTRPIWHTELITEVWHMLPARNLLPIGVDFNATASSVFVLAPIAARILWIRLAQTRTRHTDAPRRHSINFGGRPMTLDASSIHASSLQEHDGNENVKARHCFANKCFVRQSEFADAYL